MELYTRTWKNKETVNIEGFEIPVTIPDRPSLRLMKNHGLPMADQFYQKTVFPKWEEMTFQEQMRFVNIEKHRRTHGEWWLVRGREIYVNGWAHFYFNYWWAEYGALPDFREEAIEFFLVWDHVFRDSNCFGLFDIKGRRAGDTEKALCIGYDLVTRYRNSWAGSQNIKDDDAKANFIRALTAHENMQPWFKPLTLLGESEGIDFDVPKDKTTAARTDRSKTATGNLGLSSRLDYRPTQLAEYDGKRLRYYYMDEPGKLAPKKMGLLEQWEIIQPCLSLFNKKYIIGKAMFTTTVEKIKGGGSIEACRELWNDSDPKTRQANGRTTSGLYRYMRDFIRGSQHDEYGLLNRELAWKTWNDEYASYVNKGDLEGIANYKRKFPRHAEDALATPATECPMFPELLDSQIEHIDQIFRSGTIDERELLEVRGDLVWERGFGSKVIWVPNPISGKWYISIHPDNPNNNIIARNKPAPGNVGLFTIGIDPIDHHKAGQDVRYSKGGIVVYRPYNYLYESPSIFDPETGEIININKMKTDRFCCTYRNRPNDPFVFYEDALKTILYYACPAFIERDKPGLLGYLKTHKYSNYLAYKSPVLGVGMLETQPGAKTSESLINVFIPMLQSHIARRVANYYHLELLQDCRNFTGESLTVHDLLVSAGYALMQAAPYEAKKAREQSGWQHSPLNPN